jgi:hypothetical protein
MNKRLQETSVDLLRTTIDQNSCNSTATNTIDKMKQEYGESEGKHATTQTSNNDNDVQCGVHTCEVKEPIVYLSFLHDYNFCS